MRGLRPGLSRSGQEEKPIKNFTKRKVLVILLSLLCLYMLPYIFCSLLGKDEWVYGTSTGHIKEANRRVSFFWDGKAYVPLFFPRDQDHFVNLLYHPLLEFDRHYMHNGLRKEWERMIQRSRAPSSSGDNTNIAPTK